MTFMMIVAAVSTIAILAIIALMVYPNNDDATEPKLVTAQYWTMMVESFERALPEYIHAHGLQIAPDHQVTRHIPKQMKHAVRTYRTATGEKIALGIMINPPRDKLYILIEHQQEGDDSALYHLEAEGDYASLNAKGQRLWRDRYRTITGILLSEWEAYLSGLEQQTGVMLELFHTPAAQTCSIVMPIADYNNPNTTVNFPSSIQHADELIKQAQDAYKVLPADVFHRRLLSHIEHHIEHDGITDWLDPMIYLANQKKSPREASIAIENLAPLLDGEDVRIKRRIVTQVPELLERSGQDIKVALNALYEDDMEDVLGDRLTEHYDELLGDKITDRTFNIHLRIAYLNAVSRTQDISTFEQMLDRFLRQTSIYERQAYIRALDKDRPKRTISRVFDVIALDALATNIDGVIVYQELLGIMNTIVGLLEHAHKEALITPEQLDMQCASLLELYCRRNVIWDGESFSLPTIDAFTRLVTMMSQHGQITSLHALYEARHNPNFASVVVSSLNRVIKQMEKRIKSTQGNLVGSLSLREDNGQMGDLTITDPIKGQLSMTEDDS